MNRELAKEKAMSRDCSCVKGKDRDNNYNSIIDEIFDWHESEVKKLSIHSVSQQRELLYAVCDELEKGIKQPIPPSMKSLVINKVLVDNCG